jgi:hypothetical protein
MQGPPFATPAQESRFMPGERAQNKIYVWFLCEHVVSGSTRRVSDTFLVSVPACLTVTVPAGSSGFGSHLYTNEDNQRRAHRVGWGKAQKEVWMLPPFPLSNEGESGHGRGRALSLFVYVGEARVCAVGPFSCHGMCSREEAACPPVGEPGASVGGFAVASFQKMRVLHDVLLSSSAPQLRNEPAVLPERALHLWCQMARGSAPGAFLTRKQAGGGLPAKYSTKTILLC